MKRAQIRFVSTRKCSVPIILISISVTVLTFILILSNSKPSTSSFSGSSSVTPDSIGLLNREDDAALPELPRLAYFISGTNGDSVRMQRLLQALYHPRNHYLLHLDFEASEIERLELVKYSRSEAVMRAFKNVMVVGRGNLVVSKGPTAMASTLHGIAILLKQTKHWDWFINLGASDYPLMPQDDILHIFSYLPRDLNFLEHTSDLGWKEQQRARPIIIDPGLYHSKRSGVFWAKERRSIPASFKLFTGSSNVILTRPFLEFCVWGWDNLPRTLLMYYTNFLSSREGYFHTVLCNHKDYQNTTVNNDLHYMKWDDPLKERHTNLSLEHLDDMVRSGAPFAHHISENDPLLDQIDKMLLKRSPERITPGGWCSGLSEDPCMLYGSSDVVRPSLSSKRLEKLVLELLHSEKFRSKQCK
ncbi:xylosyltransferase 2 [Dorcoceras hygrometricum]|uniref:Xylosyltransferase 2 n=1 Tax=Dorcoceras hygrometricum TaxID=472368 RepID=A0A2Z7CXJ5_9LAMI|nr:xylosyltransferase 2 [Dorcoceras hygrometricum]